MKIEEIERLLEGITPGEWSACHEGKCSCKQVWCDEHPVAEVTSGKWGDDYPSIRLTGESLTLKAEPYMEQITYGEISEETAAANAKFIAAAPQIIRSLIAQVKETEEVLDECYRLCCRVDADGDFLNETLARRINKLRRKTEQEIGNGSRVDDNDDIAE